MAQKRFAFVDGLSSLYLPVQTQAAAGKPGEVVLQSPKLAKVGEGILSVVQSLHSSGDSQGTGKVMLIIDALDLLLATSGNDASPVGMEDMLMDLQEVWAFAGPIFKGLC
jgi:elongator complex protein 6